MNKDNDKEFLVISIYEENKINEEIIKVNNKKTEYEQS